MSELLLNYRAYRGDQATGRHGLPTSERWEVADLGRPGEFCVGRVSGRWGRHYYSPRRDNSHALIAGRPGSGKTKVLATWALLPSLWNEVMGARWGQTWVLDPKNTSDYRAAQHHGALLVTRPEDLIEAIHELHAEIQRRNDALGGLTGEYVDRAGALHEGGAVSVWDLTPDQWDEHDLHPRAVFIDELSDLTTPNRADFPEGFWRDHTMADFGRAFAHVVRKSRSAGIPIIAGNQRMDVNEAFSGLVRDQFGARLVLRDVGDDGRKMMFGESGMKQIIPEPKPMEPGHGWIAGMAGHSLARVYVPEVVLANYTPLVGEEVTYMTFADLPRTERAGPSSLTPVLDAQARQLWADLIEHGRSTRRQASERTGIPLRTLEKHLLNEKAGHVRHRRMFREVEKGGFGRPSYFEAVPGAPDPSPAVDSPRRGGFTEGLREWQTEGADRKEESGWVKAGQWVRALTTGWAVRTVLWTMGLRYLWGPLKAGPSTRANAVKHQARERHGYRCGWCGRGGQTEVHHVKMLSAYGEDHVDNTTVLCQRAGRPSCHGAATAGEHFARAIRRRTATIDGQAAPGLSARLTPWAAVVHPFETVLWALFVAGLLGSLGWIPTTPQPWLIAAAVIYPSVTIIPWAVKVVRTKERTMPDHKPTALKDPTRDEQRAKETFWALRRARGWWDRHVVRSHAGAGRRARWRTFTAKTTGRYLAGWGTPHVAPYLPSVLVPLFWFLIP